MESNDQPEEDSIVRQDPRFRELAAGILRNKWLILVASVSMMLLSTFVTLQRPPTCEATTTVLINMKAGQQANPFAQTYDGTISKLTNEMAILKARGLARKVATQLLSDPYIDSTHAAAMPILRRDEENRLPKSYAGVDTIMDRLQKAVSFLPEKESDVIKIVASSSDPYEAARISNAYADMYVEQVMQQSRSRSRSVREFLEGRLTDQRTQLQQSEGALKQFMESSGVVSLDAESNQLVQELSQLEGTRNALSIEIEGLDKKLNSMQAELPQQESSVANAVGQASDPYIKLLGEQLAQLEVQRDVTIAQNDPAVLNQGINQAKLKQINDQITGLRENLRKRTDELIWGATGSGTTGSQADPLDYIRGLRQQILQTKVDLETLRSRRKALDGIIVGSEAKFHKIPRQSVDLARVQRERLSAEKLYGLVEEKYNEAAITEKSEFGYVDIVDRATPEGSKGRSSLMLNTVLGFLIGLGLAGGIVFVREVVDVRVRTPEQLSRRGFAVLSEISVLDKEVKTLKFDGALPQEARSFSPHIKLIFHPLSFTAECYRRLRTSLLRLQIQRPVKTLLVSSANPQEGKSTTLLNLAISMAETNQRVLVIDTDLRRPTIHTLLGLPRSPGFTDLVAGELDENTAVHHDVVPNLDVMTCGTAVRNPSRFFGHSQMIDAMMALRDKYAWILMDAPPVLVVNDASVLASMVDGTLLVVDSGVTRLEALERASVMLNDAGGKLLGVVLNRFDPKDAYGIYGSHRYGHYDNRHSYYRQSVDDKETS
jgi:capsular exopolysaccharide synthesis family protein